MKISEQQNWSKNGRTTNYQHIILAPCILNIDNFKKEYND